MPPTDEGEVSPGGLSAAFVCKIGLLDRCAKV